MTRGAPGVVLAYHRVVEARRDPSSLAVTPDRFAEHLDVAASVATVTELAAVGRARVPTIAITIDDGYADAAEIAAPILAAKGTPATLFVTSDVLTDPTEFWWDRLEHLLLEEKPMCDEMVLDAPSARLRVDVRTEAGRQRALRALSHRLRRLPHETIETAMASLESQAGRRSTPCDAHRRVTRAQVASLAQGGVVDIGAHTRTHSMLTALPRDRQRAELVESRIALSAVIGRRVSATAYPFGNAMSYDSVTVRVAREAGYDVACINEGGVVTAKTDRHRLPRHEVYDWPAEEFRARLCRWLAASPVPYHRARGRRLGWLGRLAGL
jgi:peptidoglycan/xylan/chitin deacetylase (PgdA/CDA1 family)